MGRPPTPTRLKKLHGTLRRDRTNPAEPKPPATEPLPPPHLSARAAEIWPSIIKVLTGMRVITNADGIAVETLCEALADLREARAALARPVMDAAGNEIAAAGATTYLTISKSGSAMIRARPETALIADADRRVSVWLAKFGLSPADRSKVSAAPGPDLYNPFLNRGSPPRRTPPVYTPLGPDAGETDDFDAFLASGPKLPPVPPRRVE